MLRIAALLLLAPVIASAAGSSSIAVFSNGTVADASAVNANFSALATTLDGFDGVMRKCANGALQAFSGATWTWSPCPGGAGTGASAGDPGTSCKAIKTAFPASTSGYFWLNKVGAPDLRTAYETYCDMATDAGGWTLVLNLNTNDAATRDYNDVGFWTGTEPVGSPRSLGADAKSQAFTDVDATELMIVAHVDGTATVLGRARYDLLAAVQNRSMHALLNLPNNTTITAARRAVTGAAGTNGARTGGDAFVDNAHAVIVNSTYSPLDSDNHTRLGTNYADRCATINCNGHNYGGIGGRHYRGGWGAYYEGAQLNGYCDTNGAYGTNGRAFHNANNAFLGVANGCTSQSSKAVDYMIFVR